MTGPVEEIQLLTFVVTGVRMAVDTEQINAMVEPGQAGEVEVVPLHEKISFSTEQVSYRAPKVILIKDEGSTSGVVIDQPEDIISVTIDSIRALPRLLEECIRPRAFWGVALKGGEIILLIDFYRLLAGKTTK